jgi:hypothetical protein
LKILLLKNIVKILLLKNQLGLGAQLKLSAVSITPPIQVEAQRAFTRAICVGGKRAQSLKLEEILFEHPCCLLGRRWRASHGRLLVIGKKSSFAQVVGKSTKDEQREDNGNKHKYAFLIEIGEFQF